MRQRLEYLRGPWLATLLLLNTLWHAAPVLLGGLLKALTRTPQRRARISAWLAGRAERWIDWNSRALARYTPTTWEIDGVDGLRPDAWYALICNHQSWVDIPVLQYVFNRRIPLLRFFLKRELIYVPILGWAWWALDFPFMRRYSRAQIERRPERRRRDLDEARRACARFEHLPVTIANFVEGTRYSAAKAAARDSSYRHLLPPKSGGLAEVLYALGPKLTALLDVSIVYPEGVPTLYDLLAGRLRRVIVEVRTISLDEDWRLEANYLEPEVRRRFQHRLGVLWAAKDERIDGLKRRAGGIPPGSAPE